MPNILLTNLHSFLMALPRLHGPKLQMGLRLAKLSLPTVLVSYSMLSGGQSLTTSLSTHGKTVSPGEPMLKVFGSHSTSRASHNVR
jgi:hypothetical protein